MGCIDYKYANFEIDISDKHNSKPLEPDPHGPLQVPRYKFRYPDDDKR